MMLHGVRKYIALFFLLTASLYSANAEAACPTQFALDYCNCMLYPLGPGTRPTAFAAPLFQCFTSTTTAIEPVSGLPYPQGIIPNVTYKILRDSDIATLFRQIVYSILTIAIALFGIKMFFGEMQNPKAETLITALKISGVVYFMANAPALYLSMLGIIVQLTDALAASASGIRSSLTGAGITNSTAFWNNCAPDASGASFVAPTTTVQLWSMWDCMFNYLLGFDGVEAIKWTGLLMLGILLAATLGTGIFIFFLIVYLILSLFFAFMRFLQTYLMAVLALSFMFMIGFLFIPLIMFRGTYSYFQKWFNFCLGYILTPVVMIGMMGMMLLLADIVLFTGTNSLAEKIEFGSSARTYSAINVNNPIVNALGYKQIQFMSTAQVDHANKSGTVCTGKVVDSGIFGNMRLTDDTGTTSENNIPVTSARIGFDFDGLHLTPCFLNMTDPLTGLLVDKIDYANQEPEGCTPFDHVPGCTNIVWRGVRRVLENITPTPAGCVPIPQGLADKLGAAPGSGYENLYKYLSGILYALAVGCLLAYIMHAIMGYLPSLVGGLVAQGTDAGNIASKAVFGQGMSNTAVNAASNALSRRASSASAIVQNRQR